LLRDEKGRRPVEIFCHDRQGGCEHLPAYVC
jgi:hypothetical protein